MRALTEPAATKTESRPRAVVASHWHALDSDAVTNLLNVEPRVGLTSSQVSQRQLQYGLNALQHIQSRPAWRVIIDQFTNIVIALLAIAAAIAWATGDNAEAIAILVVLVLNAAVGFATEWQAGRALDALRRQSRTLTRVRRNGFESTVDAEELVPGDIHCTQSVQTPGPGSPHDEPRQRVRRYSVNSKTATSVILPIASSTMCRGRLHPRTHDANMNR